LRAHRAITCGQGGLYAFRKYTRATEEQNCERQRIAQCPVSSHLMMIMDISVWIGEIETLPEVKLGNCERAKVLAPRSRARRDDSGCLIPHPSITLPIHSLTHTHMTTTSALALPVPPRLPGRGKQSLHWVTRTIWPG
jgi:hypothetical protein